MKLLSFMMLINLVLLIPSSYAFDNEQLVGDWELVQRIDLENKTKFNPKTKIYFQFLEDGSMIMTDTGFRERSSWKWHLKGNQLSLLSEATGVKTVGSIKFFQVPREKGSEDKLERFSFTFVQYERKQIDIDKFKMVKIGTFTWIFEK